MKLAPTLDNVKILFEMVDANREEFRPGLEWVDFVKKPEDEMHLLEHDTDSAEWFIQWNNKMINYYFY